MMIKAPENTPAEPIPAMVLPNINATEEGAAPHSAEPTSNRKISTISSGKRMRSLSVGFRSASIQAESAESSAGKSGEVKISSCSSTKIRPFAKNPSS